MNRNNARAIVPAGVLVITLGLVAGCGPDSPARRVPTTSTAPPSASASTPPSTTRSTGAGVIDPGDVGAYRPNVDPAQFVEGSTTGTSRWSRAAAGSTREWSTARRNGSSSR